MPCLLVLRALGLGDLLTAVPALRGLARRWPESRRVLAAPRALERLVDLIRQPDGSPVVHELLDLRLLEPRRLAQASLAQADPGCGPPAAAVNLHGRGPYSHRLLLGARPRRMIAFAHPQVPESLGGPCWRAGEHEVARWCRMLAESGVACDAGELQIERPPIPERALGATVIHPGAASPARRWPVRRWAAVAAAERIVGRRVLITGSRAEAPICRAVGEGAGLAPDAVLAGHTNLAQLAGVVAGAGRVLCGDTGVGHLATALGTPSVLLFGPVSPGEWGPPAGQGRHVVLWAGANDGDWDAPADGQGPDADASGDSRDPHGTGPDPSLLQIGVADVLDALERLEAAA